MLAKRSLGNTDIQITAIGLGVWQFSEGKGFTGMVWKGIPEDESNKIIKTAIEYGINWFDTAELYGNGASESGLSRGLRYAGVNPGEAIIATKWNPLLRTARSIKATFGKREKFLAPFPVDLHQIHNPASFCTPESEMNAMADLLDQGKIQSVGVSNFSADRMRRADNQLKKRGYALASNQVKYSLLDRKIEKDGVLETAKELGVTIIAYSPLEKGLLSGKFHHDSDRVRNLPFGRRQMIKRDLEKSRKLVIALEEIGKQYDATASQVALNWVINFHGDTVVAIPGASKTRHAQENAEVMRFSLTNNEMSHIDHLSQRSL